MSLPAQADPLPTVAPTTNATSLDWVDTSFPDHESALIERLRAKISRRFASRVPLERRRLNNTRPLVSFTFDDVPESAHSRGAAMLERFGARGVYYVSTALIGRRTPDWRLIDREGIRDLHQRGHEIGLHTHRHCSVGAITARELRADLAMNRDRLQAIHPAIAAQNFAYPYGLSAFAAKRWLSSLVSSSRSTQAGVNAGVFDVQFIKCVELADARLTPERLDFYLDAVVARNGWLVFLCHDIAASPSIYGCTTSFLDRALQGVAARGIRPVTVAEALQQTAPFGVNWADGVFGARGAASKKSGTESLAASRLRRESLSTGW